MKKRGHLISSVVPNSIADELEIEAGDLLLSINGKEIEDIFDYQYLVEDDKIVVLIEKANKEQWELEIEKDYDQDLGIEFDNGLMDEYRTCRNKCMFCFIDQMPKGMRDTLYFKDDDTRLSFLQGNYVTLTNLSEHDVNRIIEYNLSPINISFHTTNPELRCKMLNNRFAGEALKKVDRLYDAEIEMNGQIVLCKGINDGEELERSIKDMVKYIPYLRSVSVVPVGLTKYREGLYPLESFDKESAMKTLEIIHKWQEKIYKEYGTHFIHASDEWYIMAEQDFPEEERYDGYLQLENGVGMMRLLRNEFEEEYAKLVSDDREHTISMATGVLAYSTVKEMAVKLEEKFPKIKINVYKIINNFFGEKITVSGLITAKDLIEQLKGKELGKKLILPCNILRMGEEVFLDDLHISDVEKALQVEVDIVKSSGYDFIDKGINV